MIRTWQEMTPQDRTQVLWVLVSVLAATVIVLYAIAASRGHDVDYFKERLGLQEQRLNYMDQKIDRVAQEQHQHKEHMTEIRRMQEAQQRQLEDQQRWIEHWKNLPQLPKPASKSR